MENQRISRPRTTIPTTAATDASNHFSAFIVYRESFLTVFVFGARLRLDWAPVTFEYCYREDEIRHILVILNEGSRTRGPQAQGSQTQVNDLVSRPKLAHSSRFFAALRMTTITCSECTL